jgi:outer membrane protein OmpA-like peptidoglycan-associated protein
MTLKLKRGLWLWGASLAVALSFAVPLSGWQRGSVALVVALALALAWRRAGRHAARLRQDLALEGKRSLPATGFQQPVVLVCGDGLPALFGAPEGGGAVLHTTVQGCYLRVDDIERLSQKVRAILAHRPHWEGQLCVLFIVNPGEHCDAARLHGQLRRFRHQLALARRHGAALPLLQVTYLQGGQGEGPWFSWEAGAQQPDVLEAGARTRFGQWQAQAEDTPDAALRLSTGILLNGAAEWLREQMPARLDDRDPGAPAQACALACVPQLPGAVAGNLWQQWLQRKTALGEMASPASPAAARLPFPDPLLPLLPVRLRNTPSRRAGTLALWLFAAALLLALASSAWQNRQLARQVGEDLRRFLAIPQAQHGSPPAEEAISALRSGAARLDVYYRHGEPLWLGLGLYQGERLRRELLAAIAGYRIPQAAPEQAMRMPEAVRLDSLSLFAVGSASLKPDSTKLLITALVDIKAQPGWLIVIAGHTDASGNDQQNLQLSRARAGAVRDWMQRMGDIPDSCFAVQGFGSSQPIASNDTEIGRAANRRVDIRLVPEVGACALPTPAPDGKHQSHSAAVNL